MTAARELHFPEQDEIAIHPDVETTNQVGEALALVDRPAHAYLRWPFPDLDRLCGGMAPGDVWFVCAFSGNGKTTFLSSAIDAWYEQGKKVYVMPLETQPNVFRTHWACQRIGLHPGDVLSGDLARRFDGEFGPAAQARAVDQRRMLDAELERQVLAPMRNRILVKRTKLVNRARLAYAVEEAADWGADVVIVDHIDHIGDETESSLYQASVKVNHATLALAQKFEMTLVCASQLNNAAMTSGRDKLARFGPPEPNHVFMGGHKRQIATGMIGLHRKLRDRAPDEDIKSYRAAIQAARVGDADVHTVLEAGVMGATAMKLRNYGARENQRAYLAVEQGRVLHLPERDRHSATYDGMRRL